MVIMNLFLTSLSLLLFCYFFSLLLVGMLIGTVTVENNMEVSQKLKIEPPFNSVILLRDIFLKKQKQKY